MCTPLIIGAASAAAGYGGAAAAGASTAATVASVAIGAASGLSAGASYQATEYNEQLAKNEKVSLDADAKNARIAGSQESATAYNESQRLAARNRVAFASGGVDTTTGTALNVGESVAEVGSLEQMTILNNADKQALNFEIKGQQGVDLAKSQKRQAKIGLGTSLLTSGAKGYGAAFK